MGHSKIKRLAVFLALVFLFPAQAAAVREVVPIGHTAGIRMKSEGVLVVRLDTVQTANGERCPARDAGVREGDIIVSAGGTEVSSNAELQSALKAAQGGAVELSIKRGDETHSVQVTACTDQTGVYSLDRRIDQIALAERKQDAGFCVADAVAERAEHAGLRICER